jgi:glutamate racemase
MQNPLQAATQNAQSIANCKTKCTMEQQYVQNMLQTAAQNAQCNNNKCKNLVKHNKKNMQNLL